ncbi:MAG: efflux RND transporter periplasmic adaptor subunit [Planctomycetota bacterium]
MPLKDCIACNANLMPKGHDPGWCKQHGVHYCVLCHPALAQAAKPPTSLDLTADQIRATRALALRSRQSNNQNCQLHNRRIQFATIKDAEKIGVFAEPVWRARIEESVSGPGEINYDQTRVARISTPSGGTVFRAFKQQGDAVNKGDLLALIDSREVGEARAQFMQALIQARLQTQIVERLKSAAAQGGVAGRDLAMAERDAVEARMQLAGAQQALANLRLIVNATDFEKPSETGLAAQLPWLGLSNELVATLKDETSSANLLPVVSPFKGVVIQRDLVAGDVITSSHVMFVVADASQLWLDLNLSPKDARLVKPGYPVHLRPDTGDEITGTVDWIAPEADEITRTVHLRAVVPNADGTIVAHTFGTGRVVLRAEPEAIAVPVGAVQWEGCCNVVFVMDKAWYRKDSFKVIHTRTVRVGARDNRHAEILAGVVPGEMVVVSGSPALKAELLRGNLGAG